MALKPHQSLSNELLDCILLFEKQTSAVFTSISSSNLAASTPLDTLFEIDKKLASVVAKIPQHQQNQLRIEQQLARIKRYDQNWRNDMAEAESLRKELESIVVNGQRDKTRILQTRRANIKPGDILTLGRQLAPFTSAPPLPQDSKILPPDMRALQARGAIPPFPTEEIMRRGALGALDESVQSKDQPLGEIRELQAQDYRHQNQPRDTHQISSNNIQQDDFAFDLDLNPDLI